MAWGNQGGRKSQWRGSESPMGLSAEAGDEGSCMCVCIHTHMHAHIRVCVCTCVRDFVTFVDLFPSLKTNGTLPLCRYKDTHNPG